MKTQEYVKKYNLNVSPKFDHSLFVEDLASEFISLLEINKANDNLKGFENAVRCIRMKFDAIANKTVDVFPQSLWGFFYATVIVKLREELCPKDMQIKREREEQKRIEKGKREEYKKWEQEQFDDYFWNQNFRTFLFGQSIKPKPLSAFMVLGIAENANIEDVNKAFRKLSMLHHPDKGGKQDKFVEITDAKNKCLNYLESKN